MYSIFRPAILGERKHIDWVVGDFRRVAPFSVRCESRFLYIDYIAEHFDIGRSV